MSPRAVRVVVTDRWTPVTLHDLKIVDEDGHLVTYRHNPVQRALCLELGLDPDNPSPSIRGRQLRTRILKARREGVSTELLALMFLDTINNPNTRTLSIAHDMDSTKAIFEMVTRFHRNLPVHKRREAARSNTKELYFPSNDSRIFIATAGQPNVGSGATLNNVHKSERAKWPGTVADIDALDASIDEAARLGNIIEETTAQGFNHFYTDWTASERGRDDLGNPEPYKGIFFAWFDNPLYRAEVPADFQRTREEAERAAAYHLDDEQLSWYRAKKAERKELMPQEYPHTPREAFIATGNPVFDREMLGVWEQRLARVVEVAQPIFETRVGRERRFYHRLRKLHQEGTLKVWEEPDPELFHLVSADPAGGVNTDGKRSFCSASAWTFGRFRPLEQVAHIHGHWEPHEFAYLRAELAFWYHDAMLAILSANHGQSVWNTLVHEIDFPQNRGNGWGGLYYHNPAEVSERAADLAPHQRLPGWPEGGGGKAFMIEATQQYVSEDMLIINDATTLSEMFRYVHLPGGGMGGESGSMSDCVSDVACGVVIHHLRAKHAAPSRQAERFTPPQTYGGYGESFGRR